MAEKNVTLIINEKKEQENKDEFKKENFPIIKKDKSSKEKKREKRQKKNQFIEIKKKDKKKLKI